MNQNPTTVSRELYDSVRQELERVQRIATRYKLEAELWKMILVESLPDAVKEFSIVSRKNNRDVVFVLVKEYTREVYKRFEWFEMAHHVTVLIYTNRYAFQAQAELTRAVHEEELTL